MAEHPTFKTHPLVRKALRLTPPSRSSRWVMRQCAGGTSSG